MKKNFRMLILGIIIGALLVGTPALANVIWERIDVVRNQIDVMVEGEKLDADNFLYLDTTYVPIRKVAEALGMNVTYKDGVAYIEGKYAAEFGGEKVALSNGFEATSEEVQAYNNMYAKDVSMAGATEEQIQSSAMNAILQYKALAAVAADNNIVIGETFYDNFSNIIAYMKMNYGSEEAMLAAMEEAGYSYEMYKRYQETEYLYSELLKSDAFKATGDEINSYYQNNSASFPYYGVQAQHILISSVDENGTDITDEATLKKLEEKANSVYNEAVGGADFNELITKYGEDPGMAQNPEGYIFTTGEMVKEFEETAFALKDGEISKPVRTTYGWHIIKKIKSFDVQPLTDELSSYISQAIASEKVYAAINAKLAQ